MGQEAQVKATARVLRRAFGPTLSDEFGIVAERSRHSAAILRRGFFGRVWWLLTGR